MFYLAQAEAGSWNVSNKNLRGYRNCVAQGASNVASAMGEVESTYLDLHIVVRVGSSYDRGYSFLLTHLKPKVLVGYWNPLPFWRLSLGSTGHSILQDSFWSYQGLAAFEGRVWGFILKGSRVRDLQLDKRHNSVVKNATIYAYSEKIEMKREDWYCQSEGIRALDASYHQLRLLGFQWLHQSTLDGLKELGDEFPFKESMQYFKLAGPNSTRVLLSIKKTGLLFIF